MGSLAGHRRAPASAWRDHRLEAHIRRLAGFYWRNGFAFDVGATTLVDFAPGGVGGELLRASACRWLLKSCSGYVAWLPDRAVTPIAIRLPAKEAACAPGDTPAHARSGGC